MLSIGVDLAQSRDRTALATVHAFQVEEPDPRRARRRHLTLTHLEKLTPGLPYPQQAELIVAVAERLSEYERPVLWIDATGVGRAVVDIVRAASPFPVRAVTLTGGVEVAKHGQDLSVPKAELVSTLEVALSTRRLHAAPGIPFAADLDKELRAFSYELSPAGRPLYQGRRSHDDLVIALALAVYGASMGGGFGSARAFIDAAAEADDIVRERRKQKEA